MLEKDLSSFGFAFALSILTSCVTATFFYDLRYNTGLVAFPITLGFSLFCGLLLGLPLLGILSKFGKTSLTYLLGAGALAGMIVVLIWLVRELYLGKSLIELLAPLKSSGWVPIISAMSGAFPLWFLFYKRRKLVS